jgi:hypothetical protein
MLPIRDWSYRRIENEVDTEYLKKTKTIITKNKKEAQQPYIINNLVTILN